MHKILIVEDEQKLSRYIELELTHEKYLVDTAFDGKEAINKILDTDYDLILLDVMIPELDGFEVCKKVSNFSNVPIIFLTAKDEIADKIKGLDLGAIDYVSKPFEIEELLARIRANLRKPIEQKNVNAKKISYADVEIDLTTHTVLRNNTEIQLRKKEYQLLEFFIKNNELVISREVLLKDVWQLDFSQDSNVIDVQIKHLREKIDEPFDNKLIHTIRGFGYVFKNENK